MRAVAFTLSFPALILMLGTKQRLAFPFSPWLWTTSAARRVPETCGQLAKWQDFGQPTFGGESLSAELGVWQEQAPTSSSTERRPCAGTVCRQMGLTLRRHPLQVGDLRPVTLELTAGVAKQAQGWHTFVWGGGRGGI